jgi:hypothetical protein
MQVQLPDELYREAKRAAREYDMALAEVVRRGLEYMVRVYPERNAAPDTWEPPTPRRLGPFRAYEAGWRELANDG